MGAFSDEHGSGTKSYKKGFLVEVLVDEIGKVSGSWIGRNFVYKSIVLKNSGSGDLVGKIFHVKIVKAFGTYLEGRIVE